MNNGLVVDITGLDFCAVEHGIKISIVVFDIDIDNFHIFFTSELYELKISRVKTCNLIPRNELVILWLSDKGIS